MRIHPEKVAVGNICKKLNKPKFIKKLLLINKNNLKIWLKHNFQVLHYQKTQNLSMLITWKRTNCWWDWQSIWLIKWVWARKDQVNNLPKRSMIFVEVEIVYLTKTHKIKIKQLGLCFLTLMLCCILTHKRAVKYCSLINMKNLNQN